MKSILISALVSLMVCALFSCNKSNNPDPTPSTQDSLPKIASLYLPQVHSKGVEYFAYDKQTRLISIRAYSYDSSSGSPVIDSFFISSSLDASHNPPSAYDEALHFQGDPPAGETEHHELFYDGQNRVTVDSITMSTQSSFSVQHYLYDNNGNTTIEWLFGDPQIPGSYTVGQIDTMFVQNETILTDINYSVSDGTLNHLFTRSYSTHVNPVYNTALANSLGCLMVFNNLIFDFRSKYLPSHFNSQEDSQAGFTLNFLWANDAT